MTPPPMVSYREGEVRKAAHRATRRIRTNAQTSRENAGQIIRSTTDSIVAAEGESGTRGEIRKKNFNKIRSKPECV